MASAAFFAIFVVSVLFVVITRFAYGKEKLAELEASFDEEMSVQQSMFFHNLRKGLFH